jgi:hypothetical protein
MVDETQAYFLQVEDMISKTKVTRDSMITQDTQMPNYPTIGSLAILTRVGEHLNKYKNDGLLTEQDMAATFASARYFRGSRSPEEAVKDLAVVVAFDLVMKKDKPK